MPETLKEKTKCNPVDPDELEKEDSWEEDQEKREYYYDDAHGYEVYRPEDDAEDGDEQNAEDQADQQKGAVISDDPEKQLSHVP